MERGFLKRYAGVWDTLLRTLDILIIIASAYLVHWYRFGHMELQGGYQLAVLIVCIVTFNLFSWLAVYQAWRGTWIYAELAKLLLAWCAVALMVSALTFLTKTGASFSRLWAGWSFVFAFAGMVSLRLIIRGALRLMRRQGINQRTVVIVGAGILGERAVRAMRQEAWAGLTPVAFFDDDQSLHGASRLGIKVGGGLDDLPDFIESRRNDPDSLSIDQVWIALPMRSQERIERLQEQLANTACKVFFIPDLHGFSLANYSVEEMVGLPVMNMSAPLITSGKAFIKRAEDIVLSSVLLVVLSPVMLLIALAIKLESAGPVIFKQRRYGLGGQEILVWKFRSMRVTEDGDNVPQAIRDDARVTKVGAFLRKTSLDELPQLVNVLYGCMSLVGPRPHAVAHNEKYRDEIEGYMVRHQVRPGITGWAQVNGCRGETKDQADMAQRVRYDLEYIRNWSVLLDLRILFRTSRVVFDVQNTY